MTGMAWVILGNAIIPNCALGGSTVVGAQLVARCLVKIARQVRLLQDTNGRGTIWDYPLTGDFLMQLLAI